ncbi:MAG: hypothetical protein ACREGA_03700 [Candidatus Saccharimonadales bacterium]
MRYTLKTGATKKFQIKLFSASTALILVATSLSGIAPLLLSQTANAGTANNVVINEVLPNPTSGNQQIELYNPTSSSVTVGSSTSTTSWRITHNNVSAHFGNVFDASTCDNGQIGAGKFCVINETSSKLPIGGAELKLYTDTATENAKTPLDTLSYPDFTSKPGESYGLTTDGDEGSYSTFATPTPGTTNDPAATTGPVQDKQLVITTRPSRPPSMALTIMM